jgi:ATP phosphoribosyltransferase
MAKPLIFAVPKGRILDEALPLMARAGVVPDAEFNDKNSRALSFACAHSMSPLSSRTVQRRRGSSVRTWSRNSPIPTSMRR